MTTVRGVNKALREAGHAEEFVRGEGYFYFMGGEAATWFESGVYVYRLDTYSVAGWVEQRNILAERNAR